MLELLKTRRSIRKFTTEPITKEDIDKILKAGLLAPSGKNLKSAEFIVIENTETINDIAKCKQHGAGPLIGSTLAIVILADTAKSDLWVEDASIATTLMQLEIEKLGLGSCWIHMRLRKDENNVESDTLLRNLLDYPKNLSALCVLAIGHKAETVKPYTDEHYDFSKVHYEKF